MKAAKSGVLTVINAQLPPGGQAGGIEQFVTSLVSALGKLDDGEDEYLIVGPRPDPTWLEPHLGANQKLITHGMPADRPALSVRLRRRIRGAFHGVPERLEDPFFDALGADVVHFPYQSFRRCGTPTIFNPHDLQHCHYPEFFSDEDLVVRRALYPAACREARFVATESDWVRRDVVEQFQVDETKVVTIYRGAPTDFYAPTTSEAAEKTRRDFALPGRFALYPAQTWPHKNHLALLEAIARLRDEGLEMHLVCTGRQNDFWPTIASRLEELALTRQVRFLGFVEPSQLRALYRLAEFLIIPSLFEGGGFPLVEGFAEGVPVASSSATALPEYAGDAAFLFEPTVSGIADAIRRMFLDPALRDLLRQRGRDRAATFSWRQTALSYRALYRKTAGSELSAAETRLLTPPDPQAVALA